MPLRRRDWMAGAAAAALHGAGHAAAPRAADGTLRLVVPATETPFDPPQTESSQYTNTVLGCILESPLRYDYLARPVRLQPATAAAMPEVSADFRSITVRLKPGLRFSDHPAFRGQPRELVAADYVYSIKRFYDPRWNSSDLYLFEGGKPLGLAALRERAIRSRQPFDYDTRSRACARWTATPSASASPSRTRTSCTCCRKGASAARWRARWWSTTARTSARTRWAPDRIGCSSGGAAR